jgi:serine-type D-Ala-D-Ala carboxypeptidase/endopeptidase
VLVLIVSGVLSTCLGGNAALAGTPTLPQQVAAIIQPQLDQYQGASVGVVVGIVMPGASGAITTGIYYFGNVVDENNNPIPLNGTTEFEIGSVTKTFTATMLAALIQGRPWLLNLPINRIFPQTPRFQGQPVTIRDLADYTSGLPDTNRGEGSASCTFSGGTIATCYDFASLFQNLSNPTLSALQFVPGSAYLYSDLAVALLALAEPTLAGSTSSEPLQLLREWETMLDSMVLEPLRMGSTHAFSPAYDPALLPQGYKLNASGQIVQALNHNTSWPAFIGAGGIVSTPDDMMSYLEYNLGLLNIPQKALLPALHTPATTVTTGTGVQLALGWFIGTLRGSNIQLISKDGGVPGFSTQVDFAPSTGTGVFVLTNTMGIINTQTIGMQVMQLINGLTPTTASPIGDQP